MKKVIFKKKFTPFLFLAPQMIIIILFLYVPILKTFKDAFTSQDAFGFGARFSGLDNFFYVLTDINYWISFRFTIIYIFFITLITVSAGLLFAVKANNIIHGKKVYKTFLIWPYAIAPAIIGVTAQFFFSAKLGPIYNLFNSIWGFNWMNNTIDSYIYLIIVGSWKQISVNFIFFLAGLQNIPKSVIEASTLDCKSKFKRFLSITFPLLMPTTFFLIIINITYSFFDTLGIIDTTTLGAPAGQTKTLVYKAYIDGYKGLDLGSAGVQSILMLLIVLVITILQFKYIERRIYYNR